MSDDQHPEDLRPIPDGGLKDAMPGWLKRPPAWRSMPSAEQRHERTLPEPDTSEIDPKTLVDVTDLPQWLQTIAARGDVPVPEPDQAVGHALLQVQAATARTHGPEPELSAPLEEESVIEPVADDPELPNEFAPAEPEPEQSTAAEEAPTAQPSPAGTGDDSRLFTPLVIGVLVAAVLILVVAVYVLV